MRDLGGKQQQQQLKLLRAEHIAEALDVSPATVYEWARIGYIPCIRLGIGKKKPCLRFFWPEIEEWLRKRAREGRTTRIPALEAKIP